MANGRPGSSNRCKRFPKKNKFSLDKPVKDLPPKALNLLLYGKEEAATGEELQFDDEEIEDDWEDEDEEDLAEVWDREDDLR